MTVGSSFPQFSQGRKTRDVFRVQSDLLGGKFPRRPTVEVDYFGP